MVEKKKGKGYKDKDAEAKYNELESQMQTLIDEISQDDALLDPARKFSEEVISKVETAKRLEAKMQGIASSSEELNALKGLQDQLDAIDQYNSMYSRTELDGFSRRRKDVEYEQANLKGDGDKYQMIYTHPDRATDIGVIYDGTVGDASWKGYVESKYQEAGIPIYQDDESWGDLKDALTDIEGYDISNLGGDSNRNSLDVNLTSHRAKYWFEQRIVTGKQIGRAHV